MLNRMIAILCVAFAFATQAHADGPAMASFLGSIQGHFTGKGSTTLNQATGTKTVGYDIDLQVSQFEDKPDAVALDAQLNGNDGSVAANHQRLIVNGETLFYGIFSASAVPVRVLESGANTLSFTIRFTGNDGLIYDLTQTYTLTGDTLTVHTTNVTDSVAVLDDEFTATRF